MNHANLPRLPAEAYRGHAAVHWTMTIAERRQGWLSEGFHLGYREVLLHTLCRYHAACPMYCVMPDHLHLLCVGLTPAADQQLMMRQLRRHLNDLLASAGGYALQKQAFDRVLRDSERVHDAFVATAYYIAENPVRAGIIARREEYPFTGCMVPGYPTLDIWADDYWPKLWRILESSKRLHALTSAATS